jgi:hypothetical protein
MKREMENVLYALSIRSLMYAMMCTRLNITHVVSIVSKFLSNPRR